MSLTSVVIAVSPAHNAPGILGRCVRSILGQRGGEPFEIVLVGDGCHPEPGCDYPGPMPFSVPSGSGPSACRNLGIRRSRGDLVAFLDADCVAAPSWLSALAGLRDEPEEVAVYAGRLVDARSACLNFDFSVRCDQRIPFVALGNACFRRRALDHLGPLDESLRIGGEDLDLSWRATLAGMELRYVKNALVFHRGSWKIADNFTCGRRARAIARKYRGKLPVTSAFSLDHFSGVLSERRPSALVYAILQAAGYITEAIREIGSRRSGQADLPVPPVPLAMESDGFTLVKPGGVVSWSVRGGTIVVCDVRSGRSVSIEGAGACFWRLALGGKTFSGAVESLAGIYEATPEELARDCRDLLAELSAGGFLERRASAEAA